jgi:hypothetical protein
MATSAYTRSCQQISTTSADAIYGPEQLFMLSSYQDPDTAALVPAMGLTDALRAAFKEYWRAVIPACAGNAGPLPHYYIGCPVHTRVCGERCKRPVCAV